MDQFHTLGLFSKIVTIFTLILVAVVLLYAIRAAYFFVKGLIYIRRSCRVPATLTGGDLRFDGTIIAVGLDGTRFCPENATTKLALITELNSPGFVEFDLEVEGFTLPVFVDGVESYFSSLYFIDAISRSDLSTIIQASSVPPEIVSNMRGRTTRKKWRENIELRKLRIQSVKTKRLVSSSVS